MQKCSYYCSGWNDDPKKTRPHPKHRTCEMFPHLGEGSLQIKDFELGRSSWTIWVGPIPNDVFL